MRFLIYIFILISVCSNAQREDHTWFFSNTSKGLFFDFNTNAVSVTNIHAPMNEAGGYFVAAMPLNGDVMFYTDGSRIWDKSNQIMPNGNGLNNGPHILQTGLSSFFPDHPGQFFVFSNTGDVPNSGNIYYSIIDINLIGNGTSLNPLGDVISGMKNIYLTNQSTEGMIVIAGICDTYWLLIPQINSTNVKIFKIDNSGISLFNTINIGLNVGVCSQIRYSKVSQKIAIANLYENGPSTIMDFDNANGIISNAYSIPGITGTNPTYCGILDVEWSLSGQILYLTRYYVCSPSSAGQLLQYNITTPSIPPIFIASVGSGNLYLSKGLKLAPDGKIYHFYGITSSYLGIINNPDIQGLGCNYNPTAINMGVSLGQINKFPEFLVLSEPINVIVNDETICAGQSTTLIANGADTYLWDNGYSSGNTQTVSPSSTTSYIVTGTIGNCSNSDTAIVTVSPTILISVNDTTICSGQQATLTATGASSYTWSNGLNTNSQQTVSPTSTTSYIVIGTTGACVSADTAIVTVNPTPNLTLNCDTSITLGDSVQLEVNGASFYSWSPTEELSCSTCSNPITSPNSSTVYCVVGTNTNGCSDTACVNIFINNECGNIWVPSAFSPNEDGENDVLYVYGKCIKSMEFKIFNRWGEKVFESNDPTVGWNGYFHGKKMNTDVFVYFLNAENYNGLKVKLKGNITIMP